MTSSNKKKITAHQRQVKITKLIRKNQQVEIAELAKLFEVSEMTVRRDLDSLAEQGNIIRTFGGAAISEKMEFEFDFGTRRKANQKYKKLIAAEVVKLIKPGQKLILDTGTTTLELAYLLKGMKNLTVVTPSLAVASVLQFSPEIEVILLGGTIREGSPDLTGSITEVVLDMFKVNIAFQGADGVGLDGEIYNLDPRIANVDRKMRQRADKTYLLVDSSKIEKTEFAVNGHVSEADGFITDQRITKNQKEHLKKAGAKIVIAS
jgi:DeoR/GlpR family transcriptional regulator of sugar metabolism